MIDFEKWEPRWLVDSFKAHAKIANMTPDAFARQVMVTLLFDTSGHPCPYNGSESKVLEFMRSTEAAQTHTMLEVNCGLSAPTVQSTVRRLVARGFVVHEGYQNNGGKPAKTWKLTPVGRDANTVAPGKSTRAEVQMSGPVEST